MSERVAVIDIGSNSARLIILDIYPNNSYNLISHHKETIRLSEGMTSSMELQPSAMARAIHTLELFARLIKVNNVTTILPVATAAIRNAKNGNELITKIQKKTGLNLNVISGEAEAKLGVIGCLNTLDISDGLIFDLGGGSTEITLIKNRRIEHIISLPLGAVTLTEQFGITQTITSDTLSKIYTHILAILKPHTWLHNLKLPLIGIGGTARAVAKIDQKARHYPVAKLHNYRLGTICIDETFKTLISKTLEQRKKIPGLPTDRIDIIVGGTAIVKCLMEVTQGTHLIISGCGLREGLFLEHYLTKNNLPLILDDILFHSSNNMQLFYNIDLVHANHVNKLALRLFDELSPLNNLGPKERKLLDVAARLHDIGYVVNYYDHPRHSAYLIENARLFGLSHREQMLTAVIAGWHEGPANKFMRNKLYREFLDEKDWADARMLALMLAIAESLDASHRQLINISNLAVNNGFLELGLLSTDNDIEIELRSLEKHHKWLAKDLGLNFKIEFN